jgi:hypothetical protein
VGIETPTPAALIATKKKQNVRKDDPEYPLHAVHTLQAKGFEVMGGFILGLDGDTSDAFDTALITVRATTPAVYPSARRGGLRGAGGRSTDARSAANIDCGF